jgi:hypothetical protein
MADKLKQYPQLNHNRGKQFQPGNNVNPAGRGGSKMCTLVTHALREKLASIDLRTKKTYAERIADLLIECATDPDPELDKTRIMALSEIIDRCEGKPKQQLDVNDVTAELRARSDEDLMFHLEKGYWPEDERLQHRRQPKIIEGGTPTQ